MEISLNQNTILYVDTTIASLTVNDAAAVMGGMKVTPQVRVSWQHEFLDSTQSISSQFTPGSSPTFTVNGPEIGRDSALVSAGFNVEVSPAFSVYAYYDGQLGRPNYNSNSVTVGLKHDF